jgi:hypothetical protein
VRILATGLLVGVYTGVASAAGPNGGVTAGTEGTCAVTIPNGSTPPGERPSDSHHGDGSLWTVLPANGVFDSPVSVRADGSIGGIKFPWWRAVQGPLRLRAMRTDASAVGARTTVHGGYGNTGFQATTILFPTRGCWRISGSVGAHVLAFTVSVTVGREARPTPRIRGLRAARSRRGVTMRWRPTPGAVAYEISIRSSVHTWRTLASRILRTTYVVALPRPRRMVQLRIRAHDDFGPGPWSIIGVAPSNG